MKSQNKILILFFSLLSIYGLLLFLKEIYSMELYWDIINNIIGVLIPFLMTFYFIELKEFYNIKRKNELILKEKESWFKEMQSIFNNCFLENKFLSIESLIAFLEESETHKNLKCFGSIVFPPLTKQMRYSLLLGKFYLVLYYETNVIVGKRLDFNRIELGDSEKNSISMNRNQSEIDTEKHKLFLKLYFDEIKREMGYSMN